MKNFDKLVLLNLIKRNGNLKNHIYTNGKKQSLNMIYFSIANLKKELLIKNKDGKYILTDNGELQYNKLCKHYGFNNIYKSIMPLPRNSCLKINEDDIFIPRKRRE